MYPPPYSHDRLRSATSISGRPEMSSSSSRSSKGASAARGTKSQNPAKKAEVWSLIAVDTRCAAAASTYALLFASVTLTRAPPGTSSTVSRLPKKSTSSVNVKSKTPSMGFCSIQTRFR